MTESKASDGGEPFQGWTPAGWQNFRTAAEYWVTVTSSLFCPQCPGKLSRVEASGTYICSEEWTPWTKKRLFVRVILSGNCPTCNGKLIGFGRRAGKTRFRCQSERRVWTVRDPAFGDAWADELGVPFDVLMKIVILSKLGWSRSRIREQVGVRKKKVLEFLNTKDIPLARIDLEAEAGPQAVYFCLWDHLLREREARTLPVKLPRLDDPWEMKAAFNDFLNAVRELQDEHDRKLVVSAIVRSLELLLITIGQGSFGKNQLTTYGGQAQLHLLDLVRRISMARPKSRTLPKAFCYWCRSSKKAKGTLAAVVETTIHRRVLCAQLKDVLASLKGVSTLATLLEGQPQDETTVLVKQLERGAHLEEIQREFSNAKRSRVLKESYEQGARFEDDQS